MGRLGFRQILWYDYAKDRLGRIAACSETHTMTRSKRQGLLSVVMCYRLDTRLRAATLNV